MKIMTLCMIHQHPRLLLGFKKRGFGKGRWNGFGGKVMAGESLEQATVREVKEEAGIGIDISNLEKAGIIKFEFKDEPDVLEVHIFRATIFLGEPIETEEMRPRWFTASELPFGDMWPADRYWLPAFLSGKKFYGRILFDPSHDILEKELLGEDGDAL